MVPMIGFMERVRRGVRSDARGIAATEFALVLPLLCLFIGGVVDLGRFLWFQTEVSQSLRAGMQYAMSHPTDTAGIHTIIQNATVLWPSANFTVTTPTTSCTCSDNSTLTNGCASSCPVTALKQTYMTMTATYTYRPLIGTMGGLLPSSVVDTMILRIN